MHARERAAHGPGEEAGKQKCGCGPSTPTAPEVKTELDDSSNEATPVSPTKAVNGNYRVRKATAKNGTSRKQSVDAVGLHRMDASQLNILPTFDGAHQKPSSSSAENTSSPPNISLYNSFNMAPTNGFNAQPMMFPIYPQQMNPVVNGSQSPDSGTTKPLSVNGVSNGIAVPNGSATPGSCCAGKNGTVSEPLAPPAPIPAPVSSCCGGGAAESKPKPKPKSCCSSNGTPATVNPASEALQMPDMSAQANNIMMSPFPSPVVIPNGMYPYFSPPTVFTYPPQYGSYLQPLQPEQWRQFMSTMNYGQGPSAGAVDMRGSMPLPIFGTPETSAGTTHQCTCGDGCQCVGCASHPYNEATQNYVRSAWNSMAEDAHHAREHTHSHKTYVNGNGLASHDIATNGHANGVDAGFQHNGDGAISPPAPQTPSDVASNDEQTLSASDFFFVTYPFGDSCAGETASCPCGDDCAITTRMEIDIHTIITIITIMMKEGPARQNADTAGAWMSAARDTQRRQVVGIPRGDTGRINMNDHRRTAETAADLPAFEALFAEYLDLQKQILLYDLEEREVRGRWKSFVSKWNKGELAEGWYDPEMFARIAAREPPPQRDTPPGPAASNLDEPQKDLNSEDDEDYGPLLPASDPSARRAGAVAPTREDLSIRNELISEERAAEREAKRDALRAARKADRTQQKERLDELLPRAEAGTRERQLEKRALVNEKMRAFRDKSPGGDDGGPGQDAEVMGTGDSLEEYKRMKANEQRRKTEREIRREEIERARREEIEERRRAYQEKEDGTVAMLRELAKQRFG
ncbi:hypothetical protein HJFPF1_08923 [Paramyrothecium foliicola]|nr:hypothetical protein HJFPF1_08923 [Paramyrothecium foliicola]